MAYNKHEAKQELRALRKGRREAKQDKVDRERQLQQQPADQQNRESDVDEVPDYEVFEEDEEEEDEEEEEAEEKGIEQGQDEKEGGEVLPVSKHAGQQHSYHVNYFGSPQVFKKKQSEREKYARFLNMR